VKQQNRFIGNIISDIDVSAIKPDQLVFPTIGIRVFNKDGQGLIATVLPGNIELFSLTDGFVMIGGVEYEGVGYILSLNQMTGEGEIGTYPTPNLTAPGFTNTYSPLRNLYTGAPTVGNAPAYPPGFLRALLFNFSIHHPVDVVAKKSFDNSVDLYFIDFYNPDRVVNNGFKTTGETNDRFVYTDNFSGAMNHIPFTKKEIGINDASVSSGGFWKPGNVFFYIRYLTADYASTPFIKEIGPVSIAQGDTLFSHSGLQEKDWSTGEDQITDRKVTLSLTNLDMNFKYFQVGVVRYSATTENGPAQQDIWLIGNYYPISGTTKLFNIYGNEPSSSLTYKEILQTPFPYPISKSQTQITNRLLKANFKRSNLDYVRVRADLIAFASKIQIGEFYYKGDFATKPISYFTGDNGLLFYEKADDVYKYLGYFKEQIYPFAVVYKFTDGTLSEAFPVKGNLNQTTEKGLYQFKNWKDACSDALAQHIITATPDQNVISGVSFNTLQAKNYYNNAIINNPSAFASVTGFMFVRAERIDNLLCQGVALRGYNGIGVWRGFTLMNCSFQGEVETENSGNLLTRWDPATAAIMPLVRGYMPTVCQEDGPNYYYHYGYGDDNNCSGAPQCGSLDYPYRGHDDSGQTQLLTYPARFGNSGQFHSTQAYDNKHGIFSPDILLDNGSIQIPGDAYVKPIFIFGSVSNGLKPFMSDLDPTRNLSPHHMGIDLNKSKGFMVNLIFSGDSYIHVHATKVDHLQRKGNLNFAGYFSSDGVEQGFDADSHVWNRDIGTCAYVGVEDLSTPTKKLQALYGSEMAEALSIVNVYKNKIDSSYLTAINDSFNISMTQYAPISELITWDDLIAHQAVFPIFKGDCFLQKTWMRSHRWYAMAHTNDNVGLPPGELPAFGSEYLDPEHVWYQWGFMIGLTVECRYNAGMRNEVIGSNTGSQYLKYSFFPKVMGDGIDLDQWIAMEPGNYAQEANQVNAGYDKVLSDKTSRGFESTEPTFEQNKPNRVYASDAHIAGSFLDGYRSIQQNSYQDFALEDGDIHYIGKNLTYAFIVQRNGINQIFVNERTMGQTAEGQDVILGTSLTFFSDRVEKLAWFGSQHKLSIVNGSKGTHGFDALQNVWWFINTFQLQSGMQKLKVTDLSGEAFILNEIEGMLNTFNPNRDVMGELPDDPLSGTGIVGFVDYDNEEVGMTFLLPVPTVEGLRITRTIIFSEKLMGFRGDYPFAESLYFNIGNMLLSQHHYLDDSFNYQIGTKMYLYNQKADANGNPNFATFFGSIKDTKISFIVNGNTEKENTAGEEKIFNALDIEMLHVGLKQIVYTTSYQTGVYDFVATEIYRVAEYIGHKWHVPIIIQTSSDQDQYKTDSELNGGWMKVTFIYHGNTDIALKAVETDFDISIQ
jgi:hypothetical protein